MNNHWSLAGGQVPKAAPLSLNTSTSKQVPVAGGAWTTSIRMPCVASSVARSALVRLVHNATHIDFRQRLLQVQENDQPGWQFDYAQQEIRAGGGDD